ncbi:phosphoribosylamine--glycine ligase [Periweissella ghanensis]|uniref:Phosphoribosylamine--glycine ligase n=1 Tax=Periweissella ghanensis TaxID=467997 RepID=A0ABM8ZCC0_9LACO|nr:phosphoribosylamine--glycine ligase [Periweissella ghanensis]MCM0600014.1 phosphoribosylamine--glycine ligase [Periweissella ghanensis]CAH0418930.1 Phosphoribosylamine--glycine ligase [Periweissella ghanensis]
MAKVLVIGNGAREHIFAQQLISSPTVEHVFVAPGNPGMVTDTITTVDIAVDAIAELVTFAQTNAIELTLVGMENALVAGVVDAFNAANLKIFGPTKAAAMLEGSKSFTKNLLAKYQITTAKYAIFTNYQAASDYIHQQSLPLVLKLDGLAFGKGVTICQDMATAEQFLQAAYARQADAQIVVEEFLAGEEFSIFTFVGKNQIITTPIAQDHKRLLDGDRGPNTGGMGAYSPVPHISQSIIDTAVATLVKPTLNAMATEGTPFTGILYTGVILTANGPKVIEFNVRFGDPEAQVVIPQLTSDFYQLIDGLVTGKQVQATWQATDIYLGVVLAAPGYPTKPLAGYLVPMAVPTPLAIDYAGVKLVDGQLQTAGGRVATIVGHAKSVFETQQVVYNYLDKLDISLQYRHDIGAKALGK